MQRFTHFIAGMALLLAGFVLAQESEAGGDLTAITVEEGTIGEFVNADPESTCEVRLEALMQEDDASDESNESDDVDVIAGAGIDGFVCLREALQTTGLTEMFSGDTSLTLLAPTDEAFAEYLEETRLSTAELFADTANLSDILSYHVLSEAVTLEDLLRADEDTRFTTALGPEIEVFSEVAGGGAAAEVDDVEIGAGPGGDDGLAEVAGNTIAFGGSYLIPIDTLLLPPAQ